MEEQEVVLKGTINGMMKILEQDFNMSQEEAKFVIYVLTSRIHYESVDKEELDAWYLSDQKYTGQILNTHLAINFTNIKQAILHKSYLFFVQYLLGRNIDLLLLGADLVYIICSAVQHIEDTDYCVFARIIEWNVFNKGHMFNIKDIVTANKDGKCDYQSDWNCTYRASDDDCTSNQAKIQLSLDRLAEQKLLRKIGEQWLLLS